MDKDDFEMNEAIFMGWKKMVISPPNGLVEILMLETETVTKKKPTFNQVAEFIRLKIGLGEEMPRVPNTRIISKTPVCVGVRDWGKYKGTSPEWFTIGEYKERVKDWKELLQKVCAFVAKDNPNEFHKVPSYISGRKRDYFSINVDDLKDGRNIPNTNIYVETNLSANNIKNLCDAIAKFFGYGDNIQVDIE